VLATLAARTVSGKTPPTAFLVTMWALTIIFLGLSVLGAVLWWRMRQATGTNRRGVDVQGQQAQAGCLAVGSIPALLVGLFLLTWAIQVS
jgi:membrane protein implicated in regulation of membrane protease activity